MNENEDVLWFFGDDNGKVVAQTIMSIRDEEKAIDALSMQVPRGMYTLGYFMNNGAQKIFNNAKQIGGVINVYRYI